MAIPNFPMTVSYTSGCTFPDKLPSISPYFQAVAVVSCLCLVSHKPKECHVYGCHSKLKCFKMETEVLTKTIENLKKVTEKVTLNLNITSFRK